MRTAPDFYKTINNAPSITGQYFHSLLMITHCCRIAHCANRRFVVTERSDALFAGFTG